VNALPGPHHADTPASSSQPSEKAKVTSEVPPKRSSSRDRFIENRITEDEVEEAVRSFLAADGFAVKLAWGRAPGTDIVAQHTDGRRYVGEAKSEVGVAGAQQHNYFVGMLGELIQRVYGPGSTYAIALPDNRQYRGLLDRLPELGKKRLRLAVFWVDRTASGREVAEEPRPI
jgi:hypothetical protein